VVQALKFCLLWRFTHMGNFYYSRNALKISLSYVKGQNFFAEVKKKMFQVTIFSTEKAKSNICSLYIVLFLQEE
jgi:hypothetical protein